MRALRQPFRCPDACAESCSNTTRPINCPTESIKPKKGVYVINADTCTECEGEFDMPHCVSACMEDDCIIAA